MRVQALPQELQDHCRDFAIVIEPSTVTLSSADSYEAPWQLSGNRATRAIAAAQYYAHSTFVFPDTRDQYHSLLVSWLRSVPTHHRALVQRIHIPMDSTTNRFGRVIDHEMARLCVVNAHLVGLLYECWDQHALLSYQKLRNVLKGSVVLDKEDAEGQETVWMSMEEIDDRLEQNWGMINKHRYDF